MLQNAEPPDQNLLQTLELWLPNLETCIQILFYITIGVVSILSYLGARKSILQPIRTEVFKVLLDELREVLSLLDARSESELRSAFHFPLLYQANLHKMWDQFTEDVFEKVEGEGQPKAYESSFSPTSIVEEEVMLSGSDYPHFFRDQWLMVATPRGKGTDDPRAFWRGYRHAQLILPQLHTDQVEKVERLVHSPLLPNKIQEPLAGFLQAITNNRHLLFEVLTEVGRELPDRFKTWEEARQGDWRWIDDLYYSKFQALLPRAQQVTSKVRQYLETDDLMK